MNGLQYLRNQVVANSVRTALGANLDALGVTGSAPMDRIHPTFRNRRRTRRGRTV